MLQTLKEISAPGPASTTAAAVIPAEGKSAALCEKVLGPFALGDYGATVVGERRDSDISEGLDVGDEKGAGEQVNEGKVDVGLWDEKEGMKEMKEKEGDVMGEDEVDEEGAVLVRRPSEG